MKTWEKVLVWLSAVILACVIGAALKNLFGIGSKDVGLCAKIAYLATSTLAGIAIFTTALLVVKIDKRAAK